MPDQAPTQRDTPDDLNNTLDILEGLGCSPARARLILRDHPALDIIVADEDRRRTDGAATPEYLLGILRRMQRQARGEANPKKKRWDLHVLDTARRREMDVEACSGCVEAADLMPSLRESLAKLAAEMADPDWTPEKSEYYATSRDWEEEIRRRIKAHQAAHPRPAPAAASPARPETFHRGPAFSEPAFERRRREQLQAAQALVIVEPKPVAAASGAPDPGYDDDVPF